MPPKRRRSPSVEFVSWARVALPPFNEAGDDDCILYTAQNTQFHVSATVLSLASPFFKQGLKDKRRDKKPLRFDLNESQTPIEIVLRLIYPIPDPAIIDLDDLADAYLVSVRYEFASAAQALRKRLSQFIEREPLRVYAIAVRFEMHEEAELAAVQACKIGIRDWPVCEEFDHIPASRYQDLILYHKRRAAEAVTLLREAKPISCNDCRDSWIKTYTVAAVKCLIEAPNSERVFTLQFVAECLGETLLCEDCMNSFQHIRKIGDFLARLKDSVQTTQLKVIEA